MVIQSAVLSDIYAVMRIKVVRVLYASYNSGDFLIQMLSIDTLDWEKLKK